MASSAAFADDAKDDPKARWTPALSLEIGPNVHATEGSSMTANDDPLGDPPRPGSARENTLISAHISGALEIMTPAVDLPGKPRLFFFGEVAHVSSQERGIAREGQPGPLIEPDLPLGFDEVAVLGQGSIVNVDWRNRFYGAGVGISFHTEIAGWQLAIKPSARYFNRELLAEATVARAFRPTRTVPETSFLVLTGDDSLDVHAVGPGLELELTAGTLDDFTFAVFLSAGAYKVLGDTKVTFGDAGGDTLGFSTYTATWEAEIDPWMYRGGIGGRVKWNGAGSGWFGLGD